MIDSNKLDSTQSAQCVDFNQDKTCEYVVLANGTSIENPVKHTTQTQKQPAVTPIPIEGKCLGFQNNYCGNLLLDNGTVVANPNFVKGVWAASRQYGGSTQPGPSKVQAAQIEDGDNGNGGGSTEGDEGNDPCNYYGLNVCGSSGQCDDERFDCYSDDCVDGQPGTTGQCEGDDKPYEDNANTDSGSNSDSNTDDDCKVGEDGCELDGYHCTDEGCGEYVDGILQDDEDEAAADDEDEGGDTSGDGGCDEYDDYCDESEGCERSDVDCIEDTNFDEDDYNG